MAKIIQHIPRFIDGIKKQEQSFNSLDELLKISWVDKFKNFKISDRSIGFYKFSVSENFLMAEYDNGYNWIVVGYIDEMEIIKELPKWEPKR